MIISHKDSIQFSILVPVYRVEKYIRTCIESVLRQTFTNAVLILVDDGTPDLSGEICDEYAKMDGRIKVIHQENKGLVAARRVAIEYALKQAGEMQQFIIFLDSDDSLKPNALQTIHETILKHHCDMVIFGWTRVHDGNAIRPTNETKEYCGAITEKRMLYRLVYLNNAYNSLCRKAADSRLFSNRDYSEHYGIQHGEDLLQSIELYKNSKEVVFIPDKLYNYTSNPASITKSITYENYEVNSTVRSRVFSFLTEEKVFGKDDFTDYIAYCRKLFCGELRQISGFQTSTANKVELLHAITEDDYYGMLLEDVSPIDCVLHSLKKGRYEQALSFLVLQRGVRSFVKKMLRPHGNHTY